MRRSILLRILPPHCAISLGRLVCFFREAEPVLDLLGERFEKVVGDDKQMELF